MEAQIHFLFFKIGRHREIAQILSLNTMGVAIVLSPLWFPHEVSGFKQAQETEVMKVNRYRKKQTLEIYKSGSSLWHIQTSQHVFCTKV